MVGRQERFFGNILLYDYLSAKRAPVLLNRNLTRAFRTYRHLLEHDNYRESAENNHNLRHLWEPPSWDTLDEMVQRDRLRGSFILDIHGIKPIHAQSAGQLEEQSEPARKARVLLRAKSTIQAAVFPPSSDVPCISIPAQDATLQSVARDTNRAVSIDTARITISAEDMALQTKPNGAYKIHISINIASQVGAEELHSYLTSQSTSVQDLSTRISTTWENILHCPTGKTMLRLRDWKGKLSFGLEVTMWWAPVDVESILAAHNRQLREKLQPNSYPAAPILPELRQLPIKLLFVYANETIVRFGLVCPHESCQRRKPTDLEDLRMHLDTWHDYFEYRAISQGLDNNGVETWMFQTEVANHKAHRAEQRASARADEPFDIRIIPPPEPFDQRRYLDEGNDDFRRMSKVNKRSTTSEATVAVPPSIVLPKRKMPDQIQNRPVRERKRYPVPDAPPGITFFRSCSRRPLKTGECISESDDEVDDAWIKLRKSAEFNKAEQLSSPFKRFLKAFDNHMWGERLQSDVHAGDALTRFVREKCDWIWAEKVFEPFKEKIDELLQDDIISKQVHDSCLEIVSLRKPIMAEEANEISHRLAQLEVRCLSHNDSHADPPILGDSSSREPTPSSASAVNVGRKVPGQRKLNKGKGKARVTDTGHLTPVTADSDGDMDMREMTLCTEAGVGIDQGQKTGVVLPFDVCLCGEDAQDSRRTSPLIACNNMVGILKSIGL
jgi:hypothetical protein